MKYLSTFCFAVVAIAGFNLAAVSPSAALEEADIQESVLAPEEPDQSPDVSTDESVVETNDVQETYEPESGTEDDPFLLEEDDVLEPAIPLDY